VTAPEILFFWVARMAIAGYEYRQEKPFTNVYLTGIVRDKLGRKMSKSLGNSPDPLDLMANFGADAVRTGMLFSSPAGNDLPYDEKLIEQGRNFANKIWNAFRLVKGLTVEPGTAPETNTIAVRWFEARMNQALTELNDHFTKFRISDALMTIYKLIWDDFCAWYLEMVKPPFGSSIDAGTYDKTVDFFETLMKALHPFMPFLTEELWHELRQRGEREGIIVASWPKAQGFDEALLLEGMLAFDVITEIRNTRNAKGISPKEALRLQVKADVAAGLRTFAPIISKLSNLSEIGVVTEAPAHATTFIVRSAEYFIPVEGKIDVEKEREAILKDLEYERGFIVTVDKKLTNEKFVANAKPEVVAVERKKKADAEARIKSLEETLARL
jgi:valyl-tRNA synthetase